ncbi:MAG: class II aldolase [Alphaproteobacteria bacterium]|nr:class II aldolase [Alphaproteobacteria bacterium]
MPDSQASLRCALIRHALALNTSGLNQGTSGNLSVRAGKKLLITPTGIAYEDLKPADLPLMAMDGTWQGRYAPSSEWQMHSDILRARPDMNALVHAHPVYATALAINRMDIPAAHYMVAAAGGSNIRCARYATYGSPELGAAACEALEGRNACLLANHGIVALGQTLEKAMWLAVEVEAVARQYLLALSVGRPVLLDAAEMARVLKKFGNYGPRKKGRT